jgi:hypothetical protein
MAGQLTFVAAKIPNGASESNEVDLRPYKLRAIQMPAAWTDADLSFLSRPGVTSTSSVLAAGASDALQVVRATEDAPLEVVIGVQLACYHVLLDGDRVLVEGLAITKVCSGNSAARVNQGADRTLLLVVEPRGI